MSVINALLSNYMIEALQEANKTHKTIYIEVLFDATADTIHLMCRTKNEQIYLIVNTTLSLNDDHIIRLMFNQLGIELLNYNRNKSGLFTHIVSFDKMRLIYERLHP